MSIVYESDPEPEVRGGTDGGPRAAAPRACEKLRHAAEFLFEVLQRVSALIYIPK